MNRLGKIITAALDHDRTPAERDAYFENELRSREVLREGKVGYEFHIRVHSYPERHKMSMKPVPVHEINHILNSKTGAGIAIQLLGYSSSTSCLLIKLYNLPFLEFYVPRNPGDPSYNECKLSRSAKDEVAALSLAKELFETKGDPLAFAGVLIDHYKN
jgi:hypothetical protein